MPLSPPVPRELLHLRDITLRGWRRADGLSDRQRAICAMAERLTLRPLECGEAELDELRSHGLSDEDAWDVIEVAAMYNFTNRLALATGQMPNPEYHSQAR